VGSILSYKHGEDSVSGVDPRLWDIVQNAIAVSPYNAVIRSGSEKRGSNGGNHNPGWAVDVTLYDPQTGKKLPDYQNGASFAAYEQYAQAARVYQQANYPELNNTFRWGGYFGSKKGTSGYGAVDLMHLDINPNMKGATSLGSWSKGAGKTLLAAYPGAQTNGGLGGSNGARLVAQYQSAYTNKGKYAPPGNIGGAPTPLSMTASMAAARMGGTSDQTLRDAMLAWASPEPIESGAMGISAPPRMPMARPSFSSVSNPAPAPTLARLASGKMVEPGVYRNPTTGGSYTVSVGEGGKAVITHHRSGGIDLAREMNAPTVLGGIIRSKMPEAVQGAASSIAPMVDNAKAAASQAVQKVASAPVVQNIGNTLGGAVSNIRGFFGQGNADTPPVVRPPSTVTAPVLTSAQRSALASTSTASSKAPIDISGDDIAAALYPRPSSSAPRLPMTPTAAMTAARMSPAPLPTMPPTIPRPRPTLPTALPAITSPRAPAGLSLSGFRTVNPLSQIAPRVQARFGQSLFGSLFNAVTAGSVPMAGNNGGGKATGAQLAAMQAAAHTAQDPALAAALAAGNKSYVPTNGDPTGVLGYGALMPTVAMNGNPIRNR